MRGNKANVVKSVIFDIDCVLLDSFEANLKFFQNLMKKTGYRPPTRKEFSALFHLSMMDTIRELTESISEEEIKKIWELGRSRKTKKIFQGCGFVSRHRYPQTASGAVASCGTETKSAAGRMRLYRRCRK